ncbi:hypothetical protein HYX01_01010 [Candidatus Woesearchaeota archaeon]|nr:hypothetical protein [Candidatus Woesearchaeota archaeon]
MNANKSQSAFEYLMIIAITLGIIVPTTYLFFSYASESNVQILDSQINQIGRNVIETVKVVYFSGEGSKITLDASMPKNVKDIYIISNRELVFKMESAIGDIEMVFFSPVKIVSNECSGDICKLTDLAVSGLNKVKIESVNKGAQVLISKA